MMQIARYGDENRLSYAEYGDRNGDPILIQHGMIASIRDYHLFDRLIESGMRVISPARPGYGLSSPYRMRDIAEWGKIVGILVDELGLSQFDVLGMSSGAPYSYAIGYSLPGKARNIFIFSGIPALYSDTVIEHWPYKVQKNASIEEMQKVAKEIFFPNVTEADLLKDDIKDSMMNDCFGIAQDLRLRCMDWGFSLSEVNQTVFMEHSREDGNVPLIAAEMTARMLPDCRLEIRDGEHFSEERLDRFIRKMPISRVTTRSLSKEKVFLVNKDLHVIVEFNDAFNRHDVAGMMQLMSNDCVFENTNPAPDGTVYRGKKAVAQFWQDFFRQSPQAHIEIEEIFDLGGRCIMRWRYNWVDEVGQEGHVRGVDVFRVSDGLIREKLSYVKG